MNVLKIWKQKINGILNKRDTQINQNFGQNIEYIANQKIENSFDSLSSELNVNIENSNSNVSQYVDTTVNTLSSQINSNISNSNSNLSNYINTSINTLSSQINTNINNSNSNTSKYVNNSISTLSSQADNTYYKKTGGFLTGDINLKGNITNRTATPSTVQQNAIAFSDKATGNYICGLNAVYYDNGYIRNRMFLASSLRSSNNGASIDIGVKNDGTIFTSTPHPESSSNDNNIATTYWVNQKLNNYYPTTGGVINNRVYIKQGISNYSVIPSSAQENAVIFIDRVNSRTIGGIYSRFDTAGNFTTNLITSIGLNGGPQGNIHVGVDKNGNIFTSAPTPVANSNGTNIATTQWVRNAGGVVTDKSNDNQFGYIKFSSGLIIQGGIITASTSGGNTLTFKKAFSSTSYTVVFNPGNSKSDFSNVRFVQRTSTTHCSYITNIAGQSYSWIAIGY